MIECILGLVIFVIAFELGRRQGWQAGFKEAEALTPLQLRQESFEHGRCFLCQMQTEEHLRITRQEH